MKKIAFLVSGGGTNMQAVLDAIDSGDIKAVPVAVISSNPKAFALERAKKHNIESFVFRLKDYESVAMRDRAMISALKPLGIDLIVCAGFLGVLSGEFVDSFPKKIVNIHPSLLPKYGGKGFYGRFVHEAVLKAGEKKSGATAHFVDHNVDTGEIICQKECAVLKGDTVETLAKRVLDECEYAALVEAVKRIVN